MGRIITLAAAFLRNKRGNFAVTFALVAVPLMLVVGLSLNFVTAFKHKADLQEAIDAATLAAAAETGINVSESQRTAKGIDFFNSNFYVIPATVVFEYPQGAVKGTAYYSVPTFFGKLFGKEKIDVTASALVGIPEDGSMEMVLALDYSGSMNSNGKYISMRDAAIAMIEEFKLSPAKDKIKLGMVPFSEYVLADIDASYIRVVHPSHYGKTARACLATRFSPFSTDGNSPDPNVEDSKWPTIGLPANFSTASSAAGAETQEQLCTTKNGKETCEICTTTVNAKGKAKTSCSKVGAAKTAAASNKADREKLVSEYALSDPECQTYQDSRLLSVPLTAKHDDLINQLKLAKPVQLTNIALAMDVSWHLISPQAPFTQGEGQTGSKPKRYVVLFTDGAQTVPGYGSGPGNGQGNSGRGNGNSDTFTIQQAERNTAELCKKIKADGIDVVTIAFQLGTGNARNQMQACASKPAFFFETQSQGDLAAIFQEITSLASQSLYLRE